MLNCYATTRVCLGVLALKRKIYKHSVRKAHAWTTMLMTNVCEPKFTLMDVNASSFTSGCSNDQPQKCKSEKTPNNLWRFSIAKD